MLLLAVALGSAAGGVLRYALSVSFAGAFPWVTFAINVAGSFLIGVLISASSPNGALPLTPQMRALLMPGFCGGLTTFSTFSADALVLWEQSPGRAASYVAASVVLGLAAAWVGTVIARPSTSPL